MYEDQSYVFIDQNMLPYACAEIVDKSFIKQVDRSVIQNSVFIDQCDAMRVVVDINIDDIGKLLNGSLNVLGNRTKTKNLYRMIANNYTRLDHHIDVIRKGINVRVNYQLENQRTGHIMRSMVETFYIPNRNYFIDINSGNVDDNAIICNFYDTIVSTINQFTYGQDRMILRIKNVELFYECVRPFDMPSRYPEPLHDPRMSNYELYKYHRDMNHDIDMYCNMPKENIIPSRWNLFNRFYHFDNVNQDIIFHDHEIYDRRTPIISIACGTVPVNKAFTINPCHKIIFKFSIWKNDVTLIHDVSKIAQLLAIPTCDTIQHPDHDHEDRAIRDHKFLMSITKKQNDTINKLVQVVNNLNNTVKGEDEEVEDIESLPDIPDKHPIHHKPPKPSDDNCGCNCNCSSTGYEAITDDLIAQAVSDAAVLVDALQ